MVVFELPAWQHAAPLQLAALAELAALAFLQLTSLPSCSKIMLAAGMVKEMLLLEPTMLCSRPLLARLLPAEGPLNPEVPKLG